MVNRTTSPVASTEEDIQAMKRHMHTALPGSSYLGHHAHGAIFGLAGGSSVAKLFFSMVHGQNDAVESIAMKKMSGLHICPRIHGCGIIGQWTCIIREKLSTIPVRILDDIDSDSNLLESIDLAESYTWENRNPHGRNHPSALASAAFLECLGHRRIANIAGNILEAREALRTVGVRMSDLDIGRSFGITRNGEMKIREASLFVANEKKMLEAEHQAMVGQDMTHICMGLNSKKYRLSRGDVEGILFTSKKGLYPKSG